MARLPQHKIGMSNSNWDKLKLEAELNGLKNNISQYIVKRLSLDDIDDSGKPVLRKVFDNRSSIKLSSELQRMFAANSNNLNQLTKSVNTLKNENVNDEFIKYIENTINNINQTFEAIRDELISNPKESKILNSSESKISDEYTIIKDHNLSNQIIEQKNEDEFILSDDEKIKFKYSKELKFGEICVIEFAIDPEKVNSTILEQEQGNSKKIGEILLENNIITEEIRNKILQIQKL